MSACLFVPYLGDTVNTAPMGQSFKKILKEQYWEFIQIWILKIFMLLSLVYAKQTNPPPLKALSSSPLLSLREGSENLNSKFKVFFSWTLLTNLFCLVCIFDLTQAYPHPRNVYHTIYKIIHFYIFTNFILISYILMKELNKSSPLIVILQDMSSSQYSCRANMLWTTFPWHRSGPTDQKQSLVLPWSRANSGHSSE